MNRGALQARLTTPDAATHHDLIHSYLPEAERQTNVGSNGVLLDILGNPAVSGAAMRDRRHHPKRPEELGATVC